MGGILKSFFKKKKKKATKTKKSAHSQNDYIPKSIQLCGLFRSNHAYYQKNNPINLKVKSAKKKRVYYKIHNGIEPQDYRYLIVKQKSSITYATGLAHIQVFLLRFRP